MSDAGAKGRWSIDRLPDAVDVSEFDFGQVIGILARRGTRGADQVRFGLVLPRDVAHSLYRQLGRMLREPAHKNPG